MDMNVIIRNDGAILTFEKEICKCDDDGWIKIIICEKPEHECCIRVKLCDLLCAIEKLEPCHKK